MSDTTLTIPPNTRLLSIERLPTGWAIWIHTNNLELAKPHSEREGTFLFLHDGGSANRVTVDGERLDDLQVME